ncbi:hypothetical protein DFQ29_008202 [Apophysomyces sp. BC1021]|nr:hypothetical protein DFQ29_008202 [Apophysomyces sp. BC1021]
MRAVSNDTLQKVDGYTFVKSNLISESNTCEEKKGTLSHRQQPPKKPSAGSKRKKQKKGSGKQEESSKRKEDPKRQSYDDPNTGEEVQLHEMTRATSAWTYGLCNYEVSIAAQKAKLQAEVICGVLDKEVRDMSLVRQIALQMANIALRAAQTLEPACRDKVFRACFRSERASADTHSSEQTLDDATKTWTWIRYLAMEYTTMNNTRNRYPPVIYLATVEKLLLPRNAIMDNPNCYIAHPNDRSIGPLVVLMNDSPELRNVLLYSRKVWFLGYKDERSKVPQLSTTDYCRNIVLPVADQLDTAFRQCILSNFIQNSVEYIRLVLANVAHQSQGWPRHGDFPRYLMREIANDDEKKDAALEGRKQINSFIDGLKKELRKARAEGNQLSLDDISKKLQRKATVPDNWPNHERFQEYIFSKVWHIPLDIGATDSSIIDVDKCKDVEVLVRQLSEAVQEEINEFVCRQRHDLEKILLRKIGDKTTSSFQGQVVDLFDCLGATRTISKTCQTTSTDTPSKRKRAHLHEENETQDDEDEKLGQGHVLLPMFTSFLYNFPEEISFRLCPPAPSHNICYHLPTNTSNRYSTTSSTSTLDDILQKAG